MAAPAQTSEFLFLMRGANWDAGLSPQETQEGLTAMMAWLETLREQGLLTSGQPLSGEGRMVASGETTIDGPFIESKEAVGGYLLIQAVDMAEATAAAEQCPVLKYGLMIEVRPIIPQCHMADDLGVDMSTFAASS